MIKKAVLILLVAGLAVSCSRTISKDKFIGTMTALGCSSAMENSPEAAPILKEHGVTMEDIQKFRKSMKPEESLKIAMEIARRVMECHGVKQ